MQDVADHKRGKGERYVGEESRLWAAGRRVYFAGCDPAVSSVHLLESDSRTKTDV